jgi:hypothetical protein
MLLKRITWRVLEPVIYHAGKLSLALAGWVRRRFMDNLECKEGSVSDE